MRLIRCGGAIMRIPEAPLIPTPETDDARRAVGTRPALRTRRSGFYTGFGVLLLACVIAGFWPSYYGALLRTGVTPPHPGWIIHAHAAAFLGWMLIFVAQTTQVWRGRPDLHRKLGVTMAGYGVLVAVFGVFASIALELNRYSFTGDLDVSAQRLLLNFLSIVLFAGFLAGAVRYRRQPESHMRLMAVATYSLAAAGIGRVPSRVFDLPPGHPLLSQFLLIAPLLLCAAYDLKIRGKVHAVTLLGVVLNLLVFNLGFFARSDLWTSIGRGLLQPFVCTSA